MKDLQLTDLYKALKDAVRYSPSVGTDKCLQLHTFRVLPNDGAIDMQAPNFGATTCEKDTVFFYSRAWERAGYPTTIKVELPAVTAFVQDVSLEGAFTSPEKPVYRVAITVWDAYQESQITSRCTGCAARHVEQIFLDTETLLMNVLRYLGNMVEAQIAGADGPAFYNRGLLDYWKEVGNIESYQVSGMWSNNLAQYNKTTPIFRQQRIADQFYGTTALITFRTGACKPLAFDFSGATDDDLYITPLRINSVPCC